MHRLVQKSMRKSGRVLLHHLAGHVILIAVHAHRHTERDPLALILKK